MNSNLGIFDLGAGFGESMGLFSQADLGVFKQSDTYKALGISVALFLVIAYGSLTLYGNLGSLFGAGGEPEEIPDFVFESLNRTGVEQDGHVNETGWFNTSQYRGEVLIIDFMAADCSNCHVVQARLEANMEGWMSEAEENGTSLNIIAYGAWYTESIEKLNTSNIEYTVPTYPTGLGTTESGVYSNGTTTDPVRLFTAGGAGAIPVVIIVDAEGYMIYQQTTGAPTDGWKGFDEALREAWDSEGDTTDLRLAWEEPDTSLGAIWFLGMILSIMVYFSPCAFPVLPGFISYYLSIGAREDELIESGKLKSKMPSSWVFGLLAGLGMWTFFIIIGLVAALMGQAFVDSGIIHYIAIGIAVLLIILGSMMLVGITSELMGFVQKYIDKWSTTEMDDKFTPRRNIYLYGIGYAAASIDCTAAAVLPFIVFLVTLGQQSVIVGLSGLMVGLLLLMIVVTVLVGLGRQSMISFLRRATGMIKMVGSWMMIMAGIALTIFLTNAELVNAIFG